MQNKTIKRILESVDNAVYKHMSDKRPDFIKGECIVIPKDYQTLATVEESNTSFSGIQNDLRSINVFSNSDSQKQSFVSSDTVNGCKTNSINNVLFQAILDGHHKHNSFSETTNNKQLFDSSNFKQDFYELMDVPKDQQKNIAYMQAYSDHIVVKLMQENQTKTNIFDMKSERDIINLSGSSQKQNIRYNKSFFYDSNKLYYVNVGVLTSLRVLNSKTATFHQDSSKKEAPFEHIPSKIYYKQVLSWDLASSEALIKPTIEHTSFQNIDKNNCGFAFFKLRYLDFELEKKKDRLTANEISLKTFERNLLEATLKLDLSFKGDDKDNIDNSKKTLLNNRIQVALSGLHLITDKLEINEEKKIILINKIVDTVYDSIQKLKGKLNHSVSQDLILKHLNPLKSINHQYNPNKKLSKIITAIEKLYDRSSLANTLLSHERVFEDTSQISLALKFQAIWRKYYTNQDGTTNWVATLNLAMPLPAIIETARAIIHTSVDVLWNQLTPNSNHWAVNFSIKPILTTANFAIKMANEMVSSALVSVAIALTWPAKVVLTGAQLALKGLSLIASVPYNIIKGLFKKTAPESAPVIENNQLPQDISKSSCSTKAMTNTMNVIEESSFKFISLDELSDLDNEALAQYRNGLNEQFINEFYYDKPEQLTDKSSTEKERARFTCFAKSITLVGNLTKNRIAVNNENTHKTITEVKPKKIVNDITPEVDDHNNNSRKVVSSVSCC